MSTEYADFTALTEDRGILKKVIVEGKAKLCPVKGDKVHVHYVGTYVGGEKDGIEFDSSIKRESKFSFVLGKAEVISAWDKGVATMCVGEKCVLICSPEYGYNDGETRKFEIEMFGFDGEDVSIEKDMSVTKSVLQQGETIAPPLAGSQITMTYRNILTEDEGQGKTVTYVLGDPSASAVPVGIDVALRKMYPGEKAIIKCRSSKESGDDSNSISYEVSVKSYDKVPRISSHNTFKEQIEHAGTIKDRANEFYKKNQFSICLEIYKRIEDEILYLVPGQPDESDELKNFKIKLFSNLSLTYFKVKNMEECENYCKKTLELDRANEKALFRMGTIKASLGDHEEAVKFFNKCVTSFPENSAAKAMLQQSQKTVDIEYKKTQKRFRNVFKKCSDTGLGVVDPEPKEELTKDSEGEESATEEPMSEGDKVEA